MKTMKQIAEEFLSEKKVATFKQTWDYVAKEMKPGWKEEYDLTVADLEKIKIGELYTLLTTDGVFIKDQKDKWTLGKFYSYDEVQKMKINVGDLED